MTEGPAGGGSENAPLGSTGNANPTHFVLCKNIIFHNKMKYSFDLSLPICIHSP
jgi:hypothetical protein